MKTIETGQKEDQDMEENNQKEFKEVPIAFEVEPPKGAMKEDEVGNITNALLY